MYVYYNEYMELIINYIRAASYTRICAHYGRRNHFANGNRVFLYLYFSYSFAVRSIDKNVEFFLAHNLYTTLPYRYESAPRPKSFLITSARKFMTTCTRHVHIKFALLSVHVVPAGEPCEDRTIER